MKNKFSKSFLLLLSVSLISIIVSFSVSAKSTVKKNDIIFDVGSKSASVVEYKGKAKKVVIPEKINDKKVTEIKNYAFWQNRTVTTVEIPSSVKTVGEAAFNECTALSEVVFPEGTQTIGDAAFWFCTSLKTVVLPQSLKKLGNNVFKGCASLTVYVPANSTAEKLVKKISGINYGYTKINKLSASDLTLSVGQAKNVSVKIEPDIVLNSTLKYSTSDKKVATVSSKGKVTAVSCGSATITCKATDGSSKSTVLKVKVIPATVSSFKQTGAEATSVKLGWTASKNVDGYQIYKYNTSTKKWESLASTTKTSYTVKNLTLGSSLKVKIRAFKKVNKSTYYSVFTSPVTASTLNPETVKNVCGDSSTSNSIKLKWDKLSYVSGYNIYKYDSSAKKYTFIASSTTNSYNVTKLSPDTNYCFAVKSFIKNSDKSIESKSYSSIVEYATCPISTELEGDASSQFSSRLGVKWTKVEKITGYKLSYKKSADTNWTTVTVAPTETSYTLNGLSSNTKYDFRIRAYTKRSYKTFYSAYSKTLTLSTNDLPSDNDEAFNIFMTSFNALKNDKTSSILLFTDVSHTQRSVAPASEHCESILDALPMNYNKQYNIEEGQVLGKNIAFSSLIAPEVKASSVNKEDVEVSFNYDGSGFRIKLALPSENEKAPLASSFAPLPNWTRAGNNNTFKLDCVTYPKTTIEAKIQNGVISDILISMPIDAQITISDKQYKLNDTINYTYVLTYFN